jgi:hypothetical protein
MKLFTALAPIAADDVNHFADSELRPLDALTTIADFSELIAVARVSDRLGL